MTEQTFCASCGEEGPQAYSLHCDSCNKLLRTGRVGSLTAGPDDTDHPFVELMAEGCRFRICVDCIHKVGQPFIGMLIKLGERQLGVEHHPFSERSHTALATALLELEEQDEAEERKDRDDENV